MTRRSYCTARPLHSRRVNSVRESMQQTGGCQFLPHHEPRLGGIRSAAASTGKHTVRIDWIYASEKDNARYTLDELVRDGTSKALRTHTAVPRGQTWNGRCGRGLPRRQCSAWLAGPGERPVRFALLIISQNETAEKSEVFVEKRPIRSIGQMARRFGVLPRWFGQIAR